MSFLAPAGVRQQLVTQQFHPVQAEGLVTEWVIMMGMCRLRPSRQSSGEGTAAPVRWAGGELGACGP